MDIEKIKNWLESMALLAAAVFFAWKLFTGWLIVNLGVQISTKRETLDNARDYLAVTVQLKKGSIDTLWLKDISIRVAAQSLDGSGPQQAAAPEASAQEVGQIVHFAELQQLAVDDNGKIDWSRVDPTGHRLTLSPDESFQLARAFSVPSRVPILVEAAIYGNRTFWLRGFEWRASAIVLPVADRLSNSVVQPTGSAGG